MTRSVRLVVAAALVAAGLPASAFVRETTTPGQPATGLCLWWRDRQVTYRVNAATAATAPCGSAAAAEESAAAGLATWGAGASASCTDFSFAHGAASTTTRVGRDGQNLIVFRARPCNEIPCSGKPGECAARFNCWEHDQDTIALTTLSFDSATGEIWDADIEMNGWDGVTPPAGHYFTCGGPGLDPCGAYGASGCNDVDVQAVVAHESGHMLGLDHVCQYASHDPEGSCATDSVMVQTVGSVSQRALAPDDVNGVCAMYPTGAPALTCLAGGAVPPPKSGGAGGCSSAGGAGWLALLALAALAPRAWPRRAA
jgi:hypothetical protein